MLLTASACGSAGEPGTTVRSFEASLAFGVEPVTDQPVPANIAPPAVRADQADDFVDLPPSFIPEPKPRRRPAPVVQPECAKAGQNAAPKEPAGINVPRERVPAAGSYRWVRSGTQTVPGANAPIALGGFERRVIRNVSTPTYETDPYTQETDMRFTYETLQPQLGSSNVIVTTWQVRTAATAVRAPTPTTVRSGHPERGIGIKRIAVFDAKGTQIGAPFEPKPVVLLLPLWVFQGEEFESLGVDPVSGQAMEVDGRVDKTVFVDACGELIEGWRVTGTEKVTGMSNLTRTFDYVFSLPLGGILVSEATKQTTTAGTTDLQFTIGQTSPSAA